MARPLGDEELADLATRQLRDTFGLFTQLAGGKVVSQVKFNCLTKISKPA
jgi:hypothetical protein